MSVIEILAQLSPQQPEYDVVIPSSWSQGRTAYGGITAAICYQAAENLIEDDRPPRSFHCNFVGPINCDEPAKVSAEVLRTGKNVTQIMAKISQNGKVGAMVQVCFGIDRDSVLYQPDRKAHALTPPKRGKFIPQIPKLVPKFIQHFELAVEKGNLALGKSEEAVIHGWSRLKKGPESMTIATLIALFDAWPPTMFQLMRLPAPASTMSWDLEFIAPKLKVAGDEWLASVNEAKHIENGYGHEESTFWSADGRVLAYSRQVVTVFA